MPRESDSVVLGAAWASGLLKAPQVIVIASGLTVVRATEWGSTRCPGSVEEGT